MRVLLVIPPYRTTVEAAAHRWPMPLAAVQLGAVLEAAGHEVTVRDFLVGGEQQPALPPDTFKGKGLPRYNHQGAPMEECVAWLEANVGAFDVVGLHAGMCNLWETAQAIARTVKRLGRPLVVGGAYVSTATAEACERFAADVAVTQEGESVVVDAMERAANGWRGVIEGGHVEDLDALPLPAWHLAPPADYPRANGKVRAPLIGSRGCPHRCAFCCVHAITGRKFRRKSPAYLKRELHTLWTRYGVRAFCFLDDNLVISPRAGYELIEVVRQLRDTVPGFDKARFTVEEGMEVRVAGTPGLIAELQALGFDELMIGLETVNDSKRKALGKPYTPAQLERASLEFQRADVRARAWYIIGQPGDTLQSICDEMVAFSRYGINVKPNTLKLYPGTETTKQFRDMGAIGDAYDWRLCGHHTPDQPGLPFADLRRLKTRFDAVGFAADEFGVRALTDTLDTVLTQINRPGRHSGRASGHYRARRLPDGGFALNGSMFRQSYYRHFMEMVLLTAGHAGACATIVNKRTIEVHPLKAPRDKYQAALVRALQKARAG